LRTPTAWEDLWLVQRVSSAQAVFCSMALGIAAQLEKSVP